MAELLVIECKDGIRVATTALRDCLVGVDVHTDCVPASFSGALLWILEASTAADRSS